MLTRNETRRRMQLVEDALEGVANLRIDRPAYRESLWQAYLSRGDCTTYEALETAASGCSLGELIATLSSLADFTLFRLSPRSAVFVKGFGQAYRLEGADFGRARHLRRTD